MSSHVCSKCEGRGAICVTCRKAHAPRGSFFRSSCRGRKTTPCPGSTEKPEPGAVVNLDRPPKVTPHFESHTDCDVCRVSKRGELYNRSYGRMDSGGWHLITTPENKSVYLCPACHKRHEEIRTMTLEYLMTERCGLNGGRWIDAATGRPIEPLHPVQASAPGADPHSSVSGNG